MYRHLCVYYVKFILLVQCKPIITFSLKKKKKVGKTKKEKA